MINGDYNEFLKILDYGGELWIKHKGIAYFIQGWVHDFNGTKQSYIMECHSFATNPETRLFHGESSSMEQNARKFLAQPLFNEKTLPEIEQETEWIDDYMG